jgi:hypothetical protein
MKAKHDLFSTLGTYRVLPTSYRRLGPKHEGKEMRMRSLALLLTTFVYASLLAVFVVDSNDKALTTPDQTQESRQ